VGAVAGIVFWGLYTPDPSFNSSATVRPVVGSLLAAIPVSLGPEDADGGDGERREGRWRVRRGGSFEREIAHLAFDDAGIVAGSARRERLSRDLGQHA